MEKFMQQIYLPNAFYKIYSYARKQECLDEYRKKYSSIVQCWDQLKQANTDVKCIPDLVGYSRATYYRAKKVLRDLDLGILPPTKRPRQTNQPRWNKKESDLVLKIRRDNETYGKAKIAVILKRDHDCHISESTVGRILSDLKKKGRISRSPSAAPLKKKRNFAKGHAKPWSFKKYENIEVGERVQVDHMTVTKNGVRIKHFQAWERKSKHIHAQVYSNATSRSAKKFLLELLEVIPYQLLSIQVDGGSEFMAEFEQACAEMKIPLIVLPPAKPTYNGGVERGNRTFKEEFYNAPSLQADSIGAIRNELKKAVIKYNNYRPHFGIDGLTPIQYIETINMETAA